MVRCSFDPQDKLISLSNALTKQQIPLPFEEGIDSNT